MFKPKFKINDKVNLNLLVTNKNASDILEEILDRINWTYLSSNPSVIHILENNLDKINWMLLSANPNAIHIIEKNLDKVKWGFLSKNPNAIHYLVSLDKEYMKNKIDEFKQELIAYVFHPDRLMKYCDKYGIDYIDICEIY